MSIGSRIKEARLALGISQEALAKAVGVTKGAIGNYEADISRPKELILIELMNFLHIDANYIYQDYIKEKAPESDVTDSETLNSADQLLLDLREVLVSNGFIGADDDIDSVTADALVALIRALFRNQ